MTEAKHERCPLSAREFGYPKIAVGSDIPDFCLTNCESLWDAAIISNNTDGEYDVYNPNPVVDDWSPCDHKNTDLEYSHEGLQSVDVSGVRLYAIVDICAGDNCGEEYGEQSYKFECPYN